MYLSRNRFFLFYHFESNRNYRFKLGVSSSSFTLGFLYSLMQPFLSFVLSGYVLSYAILKKPEQFQSRLKSMMVKRYPRLMIPALTSCLIIWGDIINN